jgi:hypothetical protein
VELKDEPVSWPMPTVDLAGEVALFRLSLAEGSTGKIVSKQVSGSLVCQLI